MKKEESIYTHSELWNDKVVKIYTLDTELTIPIYPKKGAKTAVTTIYCFIQNKQIKLTECLTKIGFTCTNSDKCLK